MQLNSAIKTSVRLATLLLATVIVAVAPAAALATQSPDDPDAKCLKCHSKKLKKILENGETMSLQIPLEEFEKSVHRVIGCTGCHRDVAKSKHPSRQPIGSQREYSLKHNHWCHQCHTQKYSAWEGSIHARLVAEDNVNAPLCSDCHSSHEIQQRAVYEPVSGQPCSACHAAIYEAYSQSVHGQARTRGNVIREDHVQAPICSDCHRAHEVTAVAASGYLRDTCLDCHDGARIAHKNWLPNADMHLTAVSCAACHSPMAERRIDLQLYDNLAQQPLGKEDNAQQHLTLINRIDADGDGLDPTELWELLRQSKGLGQATDITLRGRMEVTSGIDAHRLAPRSEAVRSCESCHQGGANGFQNVTVSISWPDGRKHRFETDKEVLTSMDSVGSVGDFYAPGGTRIRVLDVLLVLAIAAGLALPIAHIALGRYLRKRRGKQ